MRTFILDVDGVLTTGQFFYNADGKQFKVFGPHDSDGLKMIKDLIEIKFITADKRGFDISKRRVEDMGFNLTLVTETERIDYVCGHGSDTIFMGDGYYDSLVMDFVYSIAPANARSECLALADYVTRSKGGEGAVMDACLHIKEKFFS